MGTKTIDIQEAEKNLKGLLSEVVKGKHFVLSENSKPIAQLVPISLRIPGLHSGAIWTSNDFDKPLSDQFWIGEK